MSSVVINRRLSRLGIVETARKDMDIHGDQLLFYKSGRGQRKLRHRDLSGWEAIRQILFGDCGRLKLYTAFDGD